MSANKYANLPDIDTHQDVYETEDTFPARQGPNESSEDEGTTARADANGKSANEAIDGSSLVSQEEASKLFQTAERRRGQQRSRVIYAYPPSSPPSPTSSSHQVPLTSRLRSLQAELESLEAELADPTNPLLREDNQRDGKKIDPGELMRGLVDVRVRLEKVKKSREGRGRLVGVVLRSEKEAEDTSMGIQDLEHTDDANVKAEKDAEFKGSLTDLDRRLGELEELIGSSSIPLDEAAPLPAPLLPMLTKLNTQLTLLTQPRHLDSISRRIKLLISDLDRLSASQHGRKGQGGAPAPTAGQAGPTPQQEQLLPLLTRLSQHLPQMPHMLQRMRTLSNLHAAAADAQSVVSSLESDQLKARTRLDVLASAVEGVERSLKDNAEVVKDNVSGLEQRIEALVKRLDALD